MKAVVRDRYGAAVEVLKLAEVEKPELADDGVLVRVRAASVNRLDWYTMTGRPYVGRVIGMGVRRPKDRMLGVDFSGTVEAVGKHVTEFGPGDEVFGTRSGSFAEYVSVQVGVAHKPANLTFEEASTVPVAAITALQGLRDKGQVRPGHQVLVNGASGGVGTFAVQIAKTLGAEVTAVCSTRNVEQARLLGADHVIDYTREDFTRSGRRYDVLFDNAGSRSWWACRRVLTPEATVVLVGGPKHNRLLGPLGHVGGMVLGSLFSRRKAVFFMADVNRLDLGVLRELIEAGQVRPVVERRYALSDLADGLDYMGEGHVQGKIVMTV